MERPLDRGAGLPFLLISTLVVASCGAPQEHTDSADVERMRMRITKVRYAIEQTRNALAQSRGALYQEELWMRLAELQSEEAQYHYMVVQAREQSEGAVHAPQVRFLKEEAISIYERILRDNPDTELGDRILFSIAHEYRELGDFEDMITTLQRLLENDRYEGSLYRAEALLLLGDYHFDRRELVEARRYYGQIISGPPGPLHGLARFKLAWVLVNEGDCQHALTHFEGAIDAASTWAESQDAAEHAAALAELEADRAGIGIAPGVPAIGDSSPLHHSVDVRREALVDLVYCYSTERPSKNIVSYLQNHAYNRDAYIAALEKAAMRYGTMEDTVGAADVARELLQLARGDADRLDDARMLHAAVSRSKSYGQVDTDVGLILRSMRRQATSPSLTTKGRERFIAEFEVLARDMVTKAQDEAVHAGSKEKAVVVARAYEVYLVSLPGSQHKKAMTANLADTLLVAEDWLSAGSRFREVAELATDAQEQNEASYEAVSAYQKSLKGDRPRTHLERVEARAGLRKAGLAYLSSSPEKSQALPIRFAIAETYYDEGRYQKAIHLFTALAHEYPGTNEGSAAIHLVLDSYNTLDDMAGLIAASEMFLGRGSPADAAMKTEIQPMLESAQWRRIKQIGGRASGDERDGATALYTISKANKGTSFGEQALMGTFEAARAAGDLALMYQVAEDMSETYPQSESLPAVLSVVGRIAAGRFDFENALNFLARGAQASETDRGALLVTAGQLQEQLADYDGAEKAYRAAMQGAADGGGQRQGAIHLADLYEQQGQHSQAVKALSPFAGAGDPEVLSRLGLAELRAGRSDEALEHLESALMGDPSSEASARAQYGLAEVTLAALRSYRLDPSTDGVRELIDIVDQLESLYVSVIRQGDPRYSFAALARAATAYELASVKMASIDVSGFSSAEGTQIKAAIKASAAQYKLLSTEALEACGERASKINRFDIAAQTCLLGRAPTEDPAIARQLRPRKAATLQGVEQIRARLATDPTDLESLEQLGGRYLKAGDYHAARVVLARATESGAGPETFNMLGLAAAQAGDYEGAFEAFGRAAEAGMAAAHRNMAAMYQQVGLTTHAQQARAKAGPGATPAQLLPAAR